jgi:phosphoglycolate phosphatase-like HAD superfamily hydrolase
MATHANTSIFAFDIDGTLIDARVSFDRAITELSGATRAEIERFRDTGGFNDDWELSRALVAWTAAGKPNIVERCENWRDVIAWCANDPGDLSAQGTRLYRGSEFAPGYWRDERVLVDGAAIKALAGVVDVVACTGRDAWELARGEDLLGFEFGLLPAHRDLPARVTTVEHAKKPDPNALLRLLPPATPSTSARPPLVVLFGDTHADRKTVLEAQKRRPEQRFFFVHATPEHPVQAAVDAVLAGGVDAIVPFAE